MLTQIRWCPECADDQVFEQPVCDDDPAGAGGELCCAMCGLGVYDTIVVAIATQDRSARRRAVA